MQVGAIMFDEDASEAVNEFSRHWILTAFFFFLQATISVLDPTSRTSCSRANALLMKSR
jgi:hypothetical protein